MSAADDDSYLAAQVETHLAYLSSFEEGPDVALSRLQRIDTPDAVRRRLAILIDADRFNEAADLVRDREPHQRWCDLAILALVRNGEPGRAEQIAKWANRQPSVSVGRRCAIAYGEALFAHALRSREQGEALLPGDLTGAEKESLQQALIPLRALIASVNECGIVRSAFESIWYGSPTRGATGSRYHRRTTACQ